ncbi:SET and MYND domain-containing protein 4 isoform X2 [Mycetomoellerius zeteki]|uniref:SET and MYND domain-containing protein 4 isoform X2 n=1 Tax=Mycetomoellerius zeteki TaxID=64791 RepID=UPI00084E4A6B|nr:PREDICTED: SET and MYND domain-containing protein 4-like isoform X2 [Trachymyrmex zeteki]
MDWYKVTDTLNCMLKSSRLNDEIRNMKYENELISRLLHNQEVMKFMSYWLKDLYNTKNERKQQKNLEKSTAFKLSGNKEFQSKKYVASLESYTKSATYAPSNSINLSIAIANRSASLFYLDRWQDCISDINLAIKLGYPENLRYKLHLRAAQCYLKLHNKTSAVETVLQMHSILNEHNISNETKEQLQRQINDIMSKVSCMEENADSTTDTTEFPSLPEVAYGENPDFRCASAAVEIKCAPEKGRYVVANRDIKRGQILFVEKAFAFVPLCHIKSDNCYNCCRSSGNTPVPCTECVDSTYCNITCWDEARSSYHRWECLGNQMGLWAEIGIAYLAIRMLFKCTTATDDNRLNEVQKLVTNFSKLSPDDVISYGITAIMLMMYLSKYTDFFKDVNLKECLVLKFYKDFNCDLTTEDDEQLYVSSLLLRHILQLISNGHAITKIKAVLNNTCYNKNKVFTQQEDRIATAIYPSASMMNHSCDPNIMNSFLGQFLITKATQDIAAGEEVFNCYGADFRRMLRKDRQEKMESQYCFKCDCAACTIPECEDILKKFIAKKCPECNGPLNDNCSVLYRSSMYCMDCGAAVYENIYDFTLRQAQHYFEKAEICIENENYDEALDKLKKCLRLRKDALYKYHDDIADTMDFIAKVYAIVGQWLNSISYLEHNIVAIEEKYGSWSIEVCNEINKLTDICLEYLQEESNTSSKFYKNTLKKTRRYLNRAQEIIDFTYGPWNEVYHEIAVKKEILSSILKNFNV